MRRQLALMIGIILFCPLIAHANDPKTSASKDADRQVETIKDIAYYEGKDADAVRHKLDHYLPKGKKDFPVMMFVHGARGGAVAKRPMLRLVRSLPNMVSVS
jgi:hypothetical protein